MHSCTVALFFEKKDPHTQFTVAQARLLFLQDSPHSAANSVFFSLPLIVAPTNPGAHPAFSMHTRAPNTAETPH